jgi:branched-chain amino acid aminotransferase
MKVYECTLTPQALLQADEMFLTNAVRGIEWVASYKTKRYFHAVAEKLASWIQADTVRVADENPHAEHEASAS